MAKAKKGAVALTVAQRDYIDAHRGGSMEELVGATGASEELIQTYLSSLPPRDKFARKGEMVAMTEAQSTDDDKTAKRNGGLSARHMKNVHIIRPKQ